MYLSICPLVLQDHVTLVRAPQTNMFQWGFSFMQDFMQGFNTLKWLYNTCTQYFGIITQLWDARHELLSISKIWCRILAGVAVYLISMNAAHPHIITAVRGAARVAARGGRRLARNTLSGIWGVTKPRASSTPPVSLVNGIKKTRTHVKKPRASSAPPVPPVNGVKKTRTYGTRARHTATVASAAPVGPRPPRSKAATARPRRYNS